MPARKHTYFLGRIHINTAANDPKQLLLDSLNSTATETIGRFKYGFFEIQEFGEGHDRYIYGKLVKYKAILVSEIANEAERRIDETGTPEGIVAKSDFCINYRSLIIAYRPISTRLGPNQFRRAFCRLIEAANDRFFVSASIETIQEEYTIEEALQSFDIINRVVFELHPTNPSNRDQYRPIDERLKKLEAQRFRQTIESKPGLNKSALLNDETRNALVMAVDGYGKGAIEGIVNGQPKVITTEDSPLRSEVTATDEPAAIVEQLRPIIQQVTERVK